jgi:hypothetical protein
MIKKSTLAFSAAAMATAVAFPAHAGIALGSTGNGNLFFTAWDTKGTTDTADDSSYTRDLGKFINEFATAATVSAIQTGQTAGVPSVVGAAVNISFTPDTLFNTWFGGVSSQSNVRWNVAAGDSAGDKRVLTTVQEGEIPAISNFNFTSVTTAIDVFSAQSNNLGTHGTVIDGSNTATSADGPALGSGLAWGPNFAQSAGWVNAGGVGEHLNFYLLDQNGSASGNQVLVTQFAFGAPATNMVWALNTNGSLVYSAAAPIPEPGTYALMGLGLMGVAGLARRRSNK